MEHRSSSSSSSMSEAEPMWNSLSILLNHLYDHPRVIRLMNTRAGQYLSSHPVAALAVLLFNAMGALPVGLFLSFSLVTIIISAVGFVFFEGFLLFVGGLTLLCVLTGMAFFSVVVSFLFNVFYITISNVFKGRYPQLTKQIDIQEEDSE